ncbi:sugar ABC transporter ATP-binding protein [Pseudonocardia acaciae]|uniref:sugar ABC transporter ATP-binding protein n=1 Tax=Pseudonocardia acaciae TaxID=551276 RepID=UPI00048F25A6|nr:sugar ABC transporter ATP-binding protein [Pseudonocardia acaciae]
MTDQPVVLRAEGVSKTFGGVHALRGVGLEVRRGEVHCLVGENGSGKSTLIKIVSGVERADAGAIEVDSTAADRLTPAAAVALGVQVIYQDLSLLANLTVAENIALATRLANRERFASRRAAHRIAREAVSRLGVELDLTARVEDLPVASRQLVAICRAFANRAKVLFMDEPTTALTWREIDALFALVDRLRSEGLAVVFVSHKLEEIYRISDRITVLRNGSVVGSGTVAELDRPALVRAMTGRDVVADRQVDPVAPDVPAALEVRELGRAREFADVSFTVRQGEIVGLTGLLGSGRTEIAEAIFGVHPADSGTVLVDGREVRIRSVADAISAGIGYVPGDRLTQGVFLEQSISDNVVAGSIDLRTGPLGRLRRTEIARLVADAMNDLRIKAAGALAPVRSLSGGNQQRVVLAKWLVREPRVLVLNSPTVGVDIGAKEEIMRILRERAAAGMGVLVISDDVPELVSACHRVLVVRRGRMAEEIGGDRISVAAITEELVA